MTTAISVGMSAPSGKEAGQAAQLPFSFGAPPGRQAGGGARASLSSLLPPASLLAPAASAPAVAVHRDRNNFSPGPAGEADSAQRALEWRRKRYELWAGLARVTDDKRFRKCGRSIQHEAWGVGLRVTPKPEGGTVAGFSHLYRCASVWCCPRCSPKIAHARADDLAELLKVATERGCSGTLVTHTIRHRWGQRLEDCWDAVAAGWNAVTSGKQWRSDEAAYGFVLVDDHEFAAVDLPPEPGRKRRVLKCRECGRSGGEHEKRIPWVRVVEATVGPNGWHVHVHTLLLWKNPGENHDEVAMRVAVRMFLRWQRKVRKLGFDATPKGFDVRGARLQPGNTLHEYFVKLSNEITGGHAKLAKGRGRTPFQVLGDIVDAGGESGQFEDDLKLWHEWEKASHGRRQIAWSKGLREWAGLRREKTDQEIADESLETPDGLEIAPKSWKRELADRPWRQCELLEAAESGGYAAAAAKLDEWGVSYLMYAAFDDVGYVPPPREEGG